MTEYSAPPASTTGPTPKRSGFSWRAILATAAALLLVGGGLGGWAVLRYLGPDAAAPVSQPPATAAAPAAVVRPAQLPVPVPSSAAPATPVPLPAAESFATRLALLEDRLARITVSADGALGNAGKAEALFLALATRRALDRGAPLGALEAPLRARFGESQPQAVEAIVAAARDPVSDRELLDQFQRLRATLERRPGDSLLDRMRASIDSLIVIRRADEPSPATADRLERAAMSLELGRYDLAIAEVERMPGARQAEVAPWLNRIRQRNDAARALDLIEAAALVIPSTAPPVPPPAPAARRQSR